MPSSRRPKPQRQPSGNGSPSKNNQKSLRQRMSDDLQMKKRADRTRDGYIREVRKLSEFYNQRPDTLTEQQVADYLLLLINESDYAPGTLKVCYNGIKFFYTQTEPRDWRLLDKIKIPKDKTLPDVLSVGEVRQLLAEVRQIYHRVCFWTLYTLGLRIEEGLHLEVKDIDAQCMMVHVHRGKVATSTRPKLAFFHCLNLQEVRCRNGIARHHRREWSSSLAQAKEEAAFGRTGKGLLRYELIKQTGPGETNRSMIGPTTR